MELELGVSRPQVQHYAASCSQVMFLQDLVEFFLICGFKLILDLVVVEEFLGMRKSRIFHVIEELVTQLVTGRSHCIVSSMHI